jgi:hypothetical protein
MIKSEKKNITKKNIRPRKLFKITKITSYKIKENVKPRKL